MASEVFPMAERALTKTEVESVAEAYLELLAARGIEYFFGNGGTDFAPIVEAYAKRFTKEQMLPRPIPVPHEMTAVAMAHGYTMVTGKPQVVMVHTLPGTANATNGVFLASRANIPMLFTAGRTPITEGEFTGSRDLGIHWAQESFDQGAMVREWVKWDYELRHGADLESVVDRALAITQSEPTAPVYLTLPREILAEEMESITYSREPRIQKAVETTPAPEAIAEAARALAGAKSPMLVTRAVGRDTMAVQPLIELAELLGMPVFEPDGYYVNFPQGHALHAGGDVAAGLSEADVVVVAEADVPWIPKRTGPKADALVIGLGVDPLYSKYVLRDFQLDLNLPGNPRLTIGALVEAVKGIGVDTAAAKARTRRWASAGEKRRDALKERAEAGKDQTPINKAWFTRQLAEHLGEDTILLNELGVDLSQIEFNHPGTYYSGGPAGALGWAIGASLGAKLAAPDKTVISCVGDGSYIFGSGTAGHIVSDSQGIPVLTIVWNNGIWNAVQNATRTTYEHGTAVEMNNFAITTLSQKFRYEEICEAGGGYGERVEDPAEVPGAIERALNAVQVEKRQALLNVIGQ